LTVERTHHLTEIEEPLPTGPLISMALGRQEETVQSVEYETTLDDLVEFNVYHLRTSHAGTSMLSRGSLSAGFVGFFLGLVIAIATRNMMFVALGMGLSILSALIYPPIMIRTARQNARRIYADGKNKCIIGSHRLTLDEGGLREESEGGSQYTKYSSLESISETDAFVYVYLDAVQAHMIPRTRLSSGDLTAFLSVLRERMSKNAV